MSNQLTLAARKLRGIEFPKFPSTYAHTVGVMDHRIRLHKKCAGCEVEGTGVRVWVIDNYHINAISGNCTMTVLPDVIADYCWECFNGRRIKCWYDREDYTSEELEKDHLCAMR